MEQMVLTVLTERKVLKEIKVQRVHKDQQD